MGKPKTRSARQLGETPDKPIQTTKLFKSGRSQAVRLPKELRFEGGEAHVKQVAGGVILLSKNDPWASIAEAYALADPSTRSAATGGGPRLGALDSAPPERRWIGRRRFPAACRSVAITLAFHDVRLAHRVSRVEPPVSICGQF